MKRSGGKAIAALCVFGVGLCGLSLATFNSASAECLTQRLVAQLRQQYCIASLVAQREKYATYELPTNLRKDLIGTTVSIALPENAPDKRWNDELLEEFQNSTGIQVQVIRPGNDTSVVLSNYVEEFQSSSPKADVYAIDIVWPGILSSFAEDLRPAFGNLHGNAPSLIENDTVNGKLVAVPYFAEVSLLYYRSDLLRKYHFAHPPRTWKELETQARVIQAGERTNGNDGFWGYLWQGAPSEALTCNAFEWQISQSGGPLLAPDGSLGIDPARTARVWDRARRWIGTISPPETTDQLEDDSLLIWKKGGAAFMRNWPYAWRESMQADSKVRHSVGVTVLPRGEGPNNRHADVLGGFQLMVSNRSSHKEAAIELVRFLTSRQVQRYNAIQRGYLPTQPDLYDDPAVLKANPFFGSLRHVLVDGAVARPSSLAGVRYDALSRAYFTAVHLVLTGETTAPAAVASLRENLKQILQK